MVRPAISISGLVLKLRLANLMTQYFLYSVLVSHISNSLRSNKINTSLGKQHQNHGMSESDLSVSFAKIQLGPFILLRGVASQEARQECSLPEGTVASALLTGDESGLCADPDKVTHATANIERCFSVIPKNIK